MEKKPIPTKEENPKGLHQKYFIQKIKGYKGRDDFFGKGIKPIFEQVDPDAEYFVLRLDNGGSDPVHIAACKKAVLTYAAEIKDHIPELAKDLIKRYGGE